MRVDRIIVDSYGEKSGELDFSQGNFRLIYGRNEAGKSTLLNFIRDVLFGLPGGNRNALFGDEIVGGSIEFRLKDGRSGKVSQKWSRVGKKSEDVFYASVRNPQTGVDDVLEREAFQALLGGADRNLFARYFGFTYQDLVDGSALLDKGSLDRLVYGMILGGADRLERAQKTTSKRCEDLFLPRGQRKTINEAIKRLQEAKKARSAEFGTSAYKKALDERDEAATRVAELKTRCEEARRNLRRWQTLDDAREVFEAFCARQVSYDAFLAQTRFARERLSSFDETQEDAYARLKQRRDDLDDDLPGLKSETKTLEEEVRRLEASRSLIVEYDAQIVDLSKQVELIDKTRDDLPKLERDLTRDKKLLLDELQTLGFLKSDLTEEKVDETIKLRRAPILASVFDEIADLADDEERLEGKIDELNRKIADARLDLERRTQDEESARRDFVEEFGEETREEGARELEEIDANFAVLKKDVANLEERRRELDDLRRSNDETSRALVVRVYGTDVDDEEFQEVVRSFGAENVAAPLDAEFGAIENEDATTTEEIVGLQKDSARLGKELAALESEIQSVPSDVVSFDELSKGRDERRVLWGSFKNDLLARKNFEPWELERNVDALERLTREVDELADRRYERAELSGKLEEQRRKYRETFDQKTSVDKELNRRLAKRESLQNRANELWNRVGLGRCVALSINAGREWLNQWKSWRDERAEILRKSAAWEADRNDVVERLREAFVVASCWGESEAFEIDSLDKAVCVVEKTLKNAKRRLKAYSEIEGKIKAQRDERVATEQRIAANERVLTQTLEARKILESRLDDFCRRRGYEYDAATKKPCARLNETLRQLRAWQAKYDEYDEQCEKIQDEKKRIKDFEARVDALRVKLQEKLVYERAEDYVASWERRLKLAKRIEEDFNAANNLLAAKSNDLKTKRETRELVDAKLAEIAKNAGVAREEFASFREDAKTYRDLTSLLKQESRILREKLGVKNDDEFRRDLEELKNVDSETVKNNCARFASEVAKLDQEHEERSVTLGELNGKIKTLENEGDPATLHCRYQEALSALREAINVYAPTLFARRALEESLRICKEEKIPEILGYARELFKGVTSGRYVSIEEIEPTGKVGRGAKAEKEGLGFRVFECGGSLKTAGQLSSGARDQLYLALRLAHIRQYCQQAEPLPIWADDVLLSSSHERVERLIEALKNFADEGYQVVLSTCQASTRRAFEKIVGEEFATTLRPRKPRE